MPKSVSRREMFARLRGAPAAVRPPGAIPESRFVETCTRCDACLAACPERIIVRGSGGFPVLDVTRAGCTFCGACFAACAAGCFAGDGPLDGDAAVQVSAGCLEATGVSCRVCGDVCEAGAVSFRLRGRGRSELVIDLDVCTGCGACVAPCPVDALALVPRATLPPSTEVRA